MKYLCRPAAIALVLASCLSTSHAEIRLTDVTGHTIHLDKPARRVLSLAPHITESLFAVGAGSTIVATVSFSDYPVEAESIPRIGSYDHINIESALAASPDLVLAWRSGNGEAVIERLRDLGLKVFVTEPGRLEEIPETLRQFAALTGNNARGEQVASQFEKRLESLAGEYSDRAEVSVFYQIWAEPLLTMNDDHLIADVIRLCGGRNVFGSAKPLVPTIGVESVLRADPEVIIASGMGEERPEWLDRWKRWPALRAVQNGHLYFVPPSLLQRHSTRILDGAEQLCTHLDKARRGGGEGDD